MVKRSKHQTHHRRSHHEDEPEEHEREPVDDDPEHEMRTDDYEPPEDVQQEQPTEGTPLSTRDIKQGLGAANGDEQEL